MGGGGTLQSAWVGRPMEQRDSRQFKFAVQKCFPAGRAGRQAAGQHGALLLNCMQEHHCAAAYTIDLRKKHDFKRKG